MSDADMTSLRRKCVFDSGSIQHTSDAVMNFFFHYLGLLFITLQVIRRCRCRLLLCVIVLLEMK